MQNDVDIFLDAVLEYIKHIFRLIIAFIDINGKAP